MQTLTPPRGSMPGADRTRLRVRQGSPPELVIETSNDSTQFCTSLGRQRNQRVLEIVTSVDRITARAVWPGHVQPTAGLPQEVPVALECVTNAAGPQVTNLYPFDSDVRRVADTANRTCRLATVGIWLLSANSAW